MDYVLKTNPDGKLFNEILNYLESISDNFLFVKRQQFEFNANCEKLIKELEPYFINKLITNEWPGTRLLSEKQQAELFNYKVCNESLRIIKRYSLSLFDWVYPNLPEDLAFLRLDGSVILASVTHEKEYWLRLNDKEIKSIEMELPIIYSNLVKIGH